MPPLRTLLYQAYSDIRQVKRQVHQASIIKQSQHWTLGYSIELKEKDAVFTQ
ncbi:hypothetical protein FORC22_1382 [Vibrio parahaemolyticus]|nr:hypothetical protein FORC22_1382 [Vibrio parahaemolyticus]